MSPLTGGWRMTGSAVKFTERSGPFTSSIKNQKEEGVWGRRGSWSRLMGGLADDGKRWDALSPRWTFYLVPEAEYHLKFTLFSNRGESEGGAFIAGWAPPKGWRISVLGRKTKEKPRKSLGFSISGVLGALSELSGTHISHIAPL